MYSSDHPKLSRHRHQIRHFINKLKDTEEIIDTEAIEEKDEVIEDEEEKEKEPLQKIFCITEVNAKITKALKFERNETKKNF